MATKTKPRKTKAASILEAMQEQVSTLAVPLYDRCVSKAAAARIEASWNQHVLALIIWTLEAGQSVSDLYSVLSEVLSSRVATVGRENGLGAEQLVDLRSLADNTVSQLNGPFWTIAHLVAEGETDSILTVANGDDATWGAVKRHAADRIAALAFDPSRGKVTVHYTPKGTDHAVSFLVAQATETRNDHTDAVALAESIKADNSPQWRAVQRQYRAENPAGMLDRRTKADRDRESVAIGRAIQNKLSPEEIASLIS